jgi:6-phosphogluconolactonase
VSGPEIRILEEPAAAAAELLAEAARNGANLALAGGTTVSPAYERAAQLEPDWGRAEIFFGDERAVPPTDPRSNYRLVRETLIDRLAVEPRAVHRIEGESEPEEAASTYDQLLGDFTIELALNGIGADGHTASLFPNSPALEADEERAVAVEAKLEPFVPRITLTPRVFEETDLLVYLVTGSGKAEAVWRAFAADPDPATPASLVRGRETVVLLDAPAASLLRD